MNEEFNLEPVPDIYVIFGQRQEFSDKYPTHFEVDAEYETLEEAQSQLERCKSWSGVFVDTLEIRQLKPIWALEKWLNSSKYK